MPSEPGECPACPAGALREKITRDDFADAAMLYAKRSFVDKLDDMIGHLLRLRIDVGREIVADKERFGRGTVDIDRQNEIIDRVVHQHRIPRSLVGIVWGSIFRETTTD